MNGSGLFSQPYSESQAAYDAAEITATQLGSQVDFSFLDFNTQEATPGYGTLSQLTKEEGEGGLQAADRLPSGLSLDGAFSETGLSQLSLQETEDYEGDEVLEAEVPEWACAYCGIHNPESVVKCLTTGKWFCNGRLTGSAACIITHLVRAKCKEVSLHRDSPLGDTVLECYATGSRNVFALGFVPLKGEHTVVLLARDVPNTHPAIKDLDVDLSAWAPLIEDRAFVSWLVKPPESGELARARQLSTADVVALEEAWRRDPGAALRDLPPPRIEDEPLPVALKYEDAYSYQSVFGPLIKLEAEYDRSTKEALARDDVSVQWSVGLNKRVLARFYFSRDAGDMRLVVGDELLLRHPMPRVGSGPWQGLGIVTRLGDAGEEIVVELRPREKGAAAPPTDVTVGFRVEFVWKGVSFERMQHAMKAFASDEHSVSTYLYDRILGRAAGHSDDDKARSNRRPKDHSSPIHAPGLPELNASQADAVSRVLAAPLALIQGPPGTGKTVTSATLVHALAKQPGRGQVLVAAPSNIAVDHLAERVSLTGLRVVRLQARSREAVAGAVEHLTLHQQVRALATARSPELAKLQQLKDELGELSASDERKHRALLRRLEREVLQAADVVCATCVGAGDPRLARFRFRRVLIDEATQAVEPESLIPLVMGAKQLVLVGDHCQLGPVTLAKAAGRAGLAQSLFERLMLLGNRPIRLTVQYRMHPALSRFPSDTFYEGALQNGVTAEQRGLPADTFPWPTEKPMLFHVQLGVEEISASGTSYLNRTEAAAVEKLVSHLLRSGVASEQIGIITPYEGQRAHVVATMARLGPLHADRYAAVEVASVDAFQGREKDFIVLSCVRSNTYQGVGFLSDPRRLNVALTRARYGLFVLGNPQVLAKQPLWAALLHHFKDNECLVEGPITALKQSLVSLPQRRAFFDASSFGLGGAHSNRFRPVEHAGERHDAQPLPRHSRARDPNPRHDYLHDIGYGQGNFVSGGVPEPYAIPSGPRPANKRSGLNQLGLSQASTQADGFPNGT